MGAAASGVDMVALMADLEVDPKLLMDAHARVPHDLIERAWEEIPRRCPHPNFGLRAADLATSRPFDLIDYVMRQCGTIGERIERLIRYQRLMHDANDIRMELQGSQVHLTQRFRCTLLAPRHLNEFVMGMWVLGVRKQVGEEVVPDEVHLMHAAPADVKEHAQVYGTRVRFGAPSNGVVFPRRLLDMPALQADPALAALLDHQAKSLLSSLPKAEDFLSQLRHRLAADLSTGEPDVGRVAKALGMSTRSLQRRQQHEGTSFVGVVDGVRRDLALRYLEDQQLTLTEIGYLLGFVELSSFHRAFRRWTGTTPGQFRRGGSQPAHGVP